jgi:formate hydrogenlyase subunit 3/multisubunit Na+/H+ antiporter MnhD subunit
MTSAWAIALLLLSPLAGAALAFALPRWGRWLALGTSVVVVGALISLTRHVLSAGVQMHRVGGWSAPLGIDLRADGLSILMLMVTGLIGLAVTLYARPYFAAHEPDPGEEAAPASGRVGGLDGRHAGTATGSTAAAACRHDGALHRERYFWPLFLFLWTALNGLFLTADIFNLYVTLELLGFAAVTLVALAGDRAALTAAMRYLFVSLAASLFYLLGVALVYGQCGTVDLLLLAAQARTGPVLWVALALMSGGLVAKAALFPLHFWLPPAHANAPAPVSALLSALVVKGAFYILLRLWFEAFPALLTPAVAQGFGVLGGAAVLWGSLNALFQPRLKLLIAYSTVAQLGYLFLVFPLAAPRDFGFTAWSGGLILLAAHACAKAAMFLIAGNILRAAGHDRVKDLEGITHLLPVSAFAFGLAGLSLIGLPPSGGFAGKWLLLNAALAQGQWWWAATLLLGSLLAAAYIMRVLTQAFTRLDQPRAPSPVPPVMEWTALALALVAVGLGLVSHGPAAWLRVGAPVMGPMLLGGATP